MFASGLVSTPALPLLVLPLGVCGFLVGRRTQVIAAAILHPFGKAVGVEVCKSSPPKSA